MFPASYFATRYFATRYFPKLGAAVTAWLQEVPELPLLESPRRRPNPLREGWYADPTPATVLPAQLNFAAFQGTFDRPRVRPQPVREVAFADPTPSWMFPAIVPDGIAASLGLPDLPRPVATPHPSRAPCAFEPAGVRSPDVDTAGLMAWHQPLTEPRIVRLHVPTDTPTVLQPTGAQSQSQAWDVAAEVPRRLKWQPAPPAEARPDNAPGDDISYVSGWRLETVGLPLPRPRPLRTPEQAFVTIAAAYDPQSLRVALETVLDRPRVGPGPTRDVPSDPTYGALVAQDTVAGYADFFAPLPDLPLPRPRPVREGLSVLTLDVSQAAAVPVPWLDVPGLPRPRPVLARAAVPASFEPPWYAAGAVIIVAGPYWVPARALWVSGAVAGEVGEE